jgi:cyanate permease
VGTEAALALMALTIAAGVLVRLLPSVPALYAGTVIAGLGIALGNVLVPAIIKRDFPNRIGPMTGAYTMAISASGGVAAALTVPLEDAIGRDWRAGLAVWALPALVVAAIWVPSAIRGAAAAHSARDLARPSPRLWRDPVAWRVSAFMGLQSLSFYSLLSWLPALLRSAGIDRAAAGGLLSVMLLVAVPTCLLVPVFAARRPDQRGAVVITVGFVATGLTGLLVAPSALAAVWVTLIGLAQGSLLALAFLFFGIRSPDQEHAAQLAAMAQTVGYVVAAAGPLVVGILREETGGWTAPLVFLLAMLVALLVAGLGAARARQVG